MTLQNKKGWRMIWHQIVYPSSAILPTGYCSIVVEQCFSTNPQKFGKTCCTREWEGFHRNHFHTVNWWNLSQATLMTPHERLKSSRIFPSQCIVLLLYVTYRSPRQQTIITIFNYVKSLVFSQPSSATIGWVRLHAAPRSLFWKHHLRGADCIYVTG